HPVDEQRCEHRNLVQSRVGHGSRSSEKRTIESGFLAGAPDCGSEPAVPGLRFYQCAKAGAYFSASNGPDRCGGPSSTCWENVQRLPTCDMAVGKQSTPGRCALGAGVAIAICIPSFS